MVPSPVKANTMHYPMINPHWQFKDDTEITVVVPSSKDLENHGPGHAMWRTGQLEWGMDVLLTFRELAMIKRAYPQMVVSPDPNQLGTTYTIRRKK